MKTEIMDKNAEKWFPITQSDMLSITKENTIPNGCVDFRKVLREMPVILCMHKPGSDYSYEIITQNTRIKPEKYPDLVAWRGLQYCKPPEFWPDKTETQTYRFIGYYTGNDNKILEREITINDFGLLASAYNAAWGRNLDCFEIIPHPDEKTNDMKI